MKNLIFFKNRSVVIAACCFAISSLSFGGDTSKGGGEPAALEFLHTARQFCKWTQDTSYAGTVSIGRCQGLVDELSRSLQGDRKSQLIFTDAQVTDSFGIEKFAKFDQATRTITVNRPWWNAPRDRDHILVQDHIALVALEVAGMLSVSDRYSLGDQARESWQLVNEIVVRRPEEVAAARHDVDAMVSSMMLVDHRLTDAMNAGLRRESEAYAKLQKSSEAILSLYESSRAPILQVAYELGGVSEVGRLENVYQCLQSKKVTSLFGTDGRSHYDYCSTADDPNARRNLGDQASEIANENP